MRVETTPAGRGTRDSQLVGDHAQKHGKDEHQGVHIYRLPKTGHRNNNTPDTVHTADAVVSPTYPHVDCSR